MNLAARGTSVNLDQTGLGPDCDHDPVLASFRQLSGKIGIFGGSFDPIQRGHLEVARVAADKLGLDSLVFIPAKANPLKPAGANESPENRLELIVAVIRRDPRFFVSRIEFERAGPSFTVDTLRTIREQVGSAAQLFFILGEDAVRDLPRWNSVHEIFSLVQVVPVARSGRGISPTEDLPGLSTEEIRSLQQNYIEKVPNPVSSTAIREALAIGVMPIEMLDEPVIEIIKNRKFYNFGN